MTRLFAHTALVPLAALALAAVLFLRAPALPDPVPLPPDPILHPVVVTTVDPGDVKPLPRYLHQSLDWLAVAQFSNGGWGAGQHAQQGIDDPHARRAPGLFIIDDAVTDRIRDDREVACSLCGRQRRAQA